MRIVSYGLIIGLVFGCVGPVYAEKEFSYQYKREACECKKECDSSWVPAYAEKACSCQHKPEKSKRKKKKDSTWVALAAAAAIVLGGGAFVSCLLSRSCLCSSKSRKPSGSSSGNCMSDEGCWALVMALGCCIFLCSDG